jgi:hypothetical protein
MVLVELAIDRLFSRCACLDHALDLLVGVAEFFEHVTRVFTALRWSVASMLSPMTRRTPTAR